MNRFFKITLAAILALSLLSGIGEAKTAYQKSCLTGGGATCLDGIDGAALADGDFAYVMASNVSYVYVLDDDSGAPESSPDVVKPDSNAGNKRWILQPTRTATATNTGIVELATNAESLTGTDTSRAVTPDDLHYVLDSSGTRFQNLLTNSGFGVWSNSGLTQGSGSGRQTDFNVSNILADADGASFASWAGSGATITDAGANLLITEAASAGTQTATYTCAGLAAGKLYKAAIITANGTGAWGASDTLKATQNAGTVIRTYTGLAAGTHSLIWEAVGATDKIVIGTNLAGAGGHTLNITSIYIDEVTPGCVGADLLGPDSWIKTATNQKVYRQYDNATYTKAGSFYSLKSVTTDTSFLQWPLDTIYQKTEWLSKFIGRTVTLGAWVKASEASAISVYVYDGSAHASAQNTGTDWEWLEVTYTFGAVPTYALFGFPQDANTTAYISQPMLIFGSSIGSGNYAPILGEVVICETSTSLTSIMTTTTGTTVNVEAASSGKIPKGAKALRGIVYGKNSAAGKYWQLKPSVSGPAGHILFSQVANVLVAGSGVVPCDSNGDIYILSEDGNWSGLDFGVSAVQVN